LRVDTEENYQVVSRSTKRRVLSWLSLVFIGLALAVFGWGTGYKLSLYYPPNSTAHLMPHAKLLSKNEQDATKNEALAKRPNKDTSDKGNAELALTLLFVHALSTAVCCSVPAVSQREREASRQLYQRHRASLTFFFVLPPPVLA
jgi:hypothetical protein